MDTPVKFKAYISYSHADRKWANWLHRKLESYRTPTRLAGRPGIAGPVPARLAPVFRDRDELASSSDLSARIVEALEASGALIVVCSPRAAASRWVNEEIAAFQRMGRGDRIFAFIIDGDPGRPGSAEDCFPSALRQRIDRDGTVSLDSAEPIAADARRSGDGRSGAVLKLIAGLLGVGLDDLRQREAQRRNRRMAFVTAGSLAAAVVAGYLAVSAMLAREEADQRRQQAEDLLGFMVGDLRERLEPIGRLDLLEDVGNQAMRYFSTVRVGDLTDVELRRQAQVMTQLGEIRASELQYEEAVAAFREAYERTSALYAKNPGDGEPLFARSQAEFWLGYVLWRNGRFAEARDWLVRYRDSSIELGGLDPDNVEWAQELAYAHHNIAVLDQEAGELDEAAAGFRRELALLERLQAAEAVPDRRFYIADAVSWLGSIQIKKGNLAAAVDYYERSAEETALLKAADPDNREWVFEWAHAAQRVAEVAAISGDRQRALAIAQDVYDTLEALVRHDRGNLEWSWSIARPMILEGSLAMANGDAIAAAAEARRAIAHLEPLAEASPADRYVRAQLAEAYSLHAWVEQRRGNDDAALVAVQRALDHFGMLAAAGRLTDENLGNFAGAHVLHGELQVAENGAAATLAWRAALDLLAGRGDTAQSHFLLDPRARALWFNGQQQASRRLRRALESRGYDPLRAWPD